VEVACFSFADVERRAFDSDVMSILAFTSEAPSIGLCDDLYHDYNMAMDYCVESELPDCPLQRKFETRWIREIVV
jgi:hypothetical protein